ncbi:MAG: hypothetical protein KDI38_11140 [Calditrichaeota bacterium]|nr:hypothetical protein [Calditrichota bacterium]MCB0304324.1 hypothetical protein [Calditrichota bacterium]
MKWLTLKNTLDILTPENGNTPLTDAGMKALGFKRLENGQYELSRENDTYIGYFRDEHTVSLKRIRKNIPLNSNFGYLHLYNFGYHNLPSMMRKQDSVKSLEELKELISTH